MNGGVLDLCGLVEDSHCGYCQGSRKTSLGEEDAENGRSCSLGSVGYSLNFEVFMRLLEYGWGLWAYYLTAPQYQDLIDCGWRRSGNYVYKPIMERTCCPQYTIRLDSTKFMLSRNQRKVLRVMHEYLKDDIKPRCAPILEMDTSQPNANNQKSEKRNEDRVSVKQRIEGQPSKKKEKRRQRCFERWIAKGLNVAEMMQKREEKEESRRRTIESYLLPHNDEWKHKLEVKLVSTRSEELNEREEESYELYRKYQIMVHKDDCPTKQGYKRFLTTDPFNEHRPPTSSDSIPPYGAYHQWYILDGRLVAVGVVDILPRCVSSKYMFYDPEFNFLSLGTYTALREIEFTKKLSVDRPSSKYYYMGYYIHTCPKMRYKGKFQPSDLLCDKSFQWVPLSECVKLFEASASSYVIFRPNESVPRKTINDLVLVGNRRVIRYPNLPSYIQNYAEREPAQVRANLSLLASLLPAVPFQDNFFIFVSEIHQMAIVNPENSDDSEEANDD